MEEWFDVVDDQDQVIDCRVRSEVHRLKLFHRSVHMLVFNRAGELLLQQRSHQKDDSPGLWDSSAAGHLTAGENYLDAAYRELKEELGLSAGVLLEPLFKLAACPETEHEFAWVYRCETEGPISPNREEIVEVGWYSTGNLSTWIASRPIDFASTFRLIWKRINQ